MQDVVAAIGKGLGPDNVVAGKAVMGAEDFGEFGKAAGIPSVMLSLGAVEPGRFKAAQAAGDVDADLDSKPPPQT